MLTGGAYLQNWLASFSENTQIVECYTIIFKALISDTTGSGI
jgi:hypothetical protein